MSALKEFKNTRQRLKNKLELIDWQLGNTPNDYWVENARDMIELQIERLQLLDKLRYLRPVKREDVAYRQKILETFANWAEGYIPDSLRLVFHGSTLANSERILNSGKIISGKDRWTIHTSSDEASEISVSTQSSLMISLVGHMDLIAQNYQLPAGCLFVLQTDPSTYCMAKDDCRIPNVYLRQNPKQLYGVITTPENQGRLKWWMQKNNFPADKVYDFNSFKEKIEEDALFFSFIADSYQRS